MKRQDHIYLDHNATTPVRPEVREEVIQWLSEVGNPSSAHLPGRRARLVIEHAREQVASLIGARKGEIVFVSGGTEANNWAVWGIISSAGGCPVEVVTSAIEHQSMLAPCNQAARESCILKTVGVDRNGRVSVAEVAGELTERTALCSVMLANNEVGTIQQIAKISSSVRAAGAVMHTDAVQAAGKIRVDVDSLGVDLLSLSAHKLGGPRGIGALYIRNGTLIDPIIFGGRQEQSRRAGSENVPAIAGFGVACALAARDLKENGRRTSRLRNRLEAGLLDNIEGVRVNGHPTQRLPNTLNVSFEGADGEELVMLLDELGLAVSTASACSSGTSKPSHVLTAMGRTGVEARQSLRLSLGPSNTQEHIDRAIDAVARAVALSRGEDAGISNSKTG